MKRTLIFFVAFILLNMVSCKNNEKPSDMNIIFLHHSTGNFIWKGKRPNLITKVVNRISRKAAELVSSKPQLQVLFEKYNKENKKNYTIKEIAFPKLSPYGWNNYPFDYYNIWVKNAGDVPFMEEPTLEILTKDFEVIIFKHCFPVSNIEPEKDTADINSDLKTISNYKLQYAALREKLNEFPDTRFILFTGAAQVMGNITVDEATRAKEFFDWVRNDWDIPGDNIHLWDLYNLQTEGGLYFKDEYALSPTNSHPNWNFSERVVGLLFNRIIDVIENDGNMTLLTGQKKAT